MERFVNELKELIPHVDFEKEHNLISNGILDSLSLVSIMLMINEKYQIDIPVEYMSPEYFDSAEVMYKMIKELSSKKN